MAQMSDIGSNKIVTGVRFVKKNGIIHLEIEQATALKEGKIEESSRQWVQSQNLDPQNSTQKSLGYFKTMSYEERALDIDRLEAISGKVIYSGVLTAVWVRLDLRSKFVRPWTTVSTFFSLFQLKSIEKVTKEVGHGKKSQ